MKKLLIISLFLTIANTEVCEKQYVTVNNKVYMSDCAWRNFVKRNKKPQFVKTKHAESRGNYGAINRNDLGSVAYGIVQFRGVYAKKLERKLGVTKRDSNKFIKKRLTSKRGKALQDKMFDTKFVKPVLSFAKMRGITDQNVIAILVDARVNGFKYWGKVTKYTTTNVLLRLRKRYYRNLHLNNPKRYSKKLLRAWYKRLDKFKEG